MLSPEFVKTISDWITWYNYNRRNAEKAGVENQLAFVQKAVNGLFFVVAAMADEVARVDGTPREEARKILVPIGARF